MTRSTVTFKPKADLWFAIVSGGYSSVSTVKWVAEGQHAFSSPSTPGGSAPLDWYWSGARTIRIQQGGGNAVTVSSTGRVIYQGVNGAGGGIYASGGTLSINSSKVKAEDPVRPPAEHRSAQ